MHDSMNRDVPGKLLVHRRHVSPVSVVRIDPGRLACPDRGSDGRCVTFRIFLFARRHREEQREMMTVSE